MLIRETFCQEKQFSTKDGFADLVTATDKKVEENIIKFLQNKFPKHKFLAEESAKEGEHFNLTDDPTWVIDPIDGTTNFVHRFPYVAVCIGLLVKKQAVCGIVYNPIQNELYHARLGCGAFCNERRLQVTNVEDLGKALVCGEFGSSRVTADLNLKLNSIRRVLEQAHGIRSFGSAALNMCSVASGQTDAYWEFGLHAWDIAAAQLIVTEAGGIVLSADGGQLDVMNRQVLCAGTKSLALQISKSIQQMHYARD